MPDMTSGLNAPRRRRQAQKAERAAKADTLAFAELPDYLQDNEFIKRHYRSPNMPIKRTLRSLFDVHNETGNVWTHLLGRPAVVRSLTRRAARSLAASNARHACSSAALHHAIKSLNVPHRSSCLHPQAFCCSSASRSTSSTGRPCRWAWARPTSTRCG
jgi:hypothetical protein